MLGLGDFSVLLAYIMLFSVTFLCIIYGVVNWNKGGEVSQQELEEEKQWIKEELEIDNEVGGGQ